MDTTNNYPQRELPWTRKDSEKPFKVAVVGDTILDEYLDGQVDRISPEAPVPVHLVKNRTYTPGGAANAARNIKLVGGEPILFSIAGKDEAHDLLKQIFDDEKMETSGIITCSDRPTIRKTRITTQSQQIVRIDWERVSPISEEIQNQLYEKLSSSTYDCILISDYAKGLLPDTLIQKIIEFGNAHKIPVVVDPKGTDFSKYKGATLIKPNHKEACEALGLDPRVDRDGETLCRLLNDRFHFETSLVTLGSRGMVLVSENGESISRKAVAKEVYDVSGAGDTVAAVVALGLASKASAEDTTELANLAASIVVGKWGTQPIYQHELADSLVKNATKLPTSSSDKILEQSSLLAKLKNPRFHDKKIVFTNGCFDILHLGHLSYLETAKSKGDILVIGLNSDESIRRLKGDNRPLNHEKARAKVLAGLSCVDYVTVYGDDTPKNLIESISPNVLVKGADWKVEDIVGGDFVTSKGGVVETIELEKGYSTTGLIEKIKGLESSEKSGSQKQ